MLGNSLIENSLSSWKETRLGDLVEAFYNGGTPSTSNPKFWGGSVPWITGADIVNQRVAEPRRFLSTEGVRSGSTRVVPAGSVLVVTRTGVGKVAVAPWDLAISQDITGLVVRQEIIRSDFLYWWLVTYSSKLKQQRQGTSINGILREDLEELRLVLPPRNLQQKIAESLGAIDTVIDQTETVIKAITNLRDALLQEVLTYGVPGWHNEWQHVAGIGTIPARWTVRPLGDVLEKTQYGTNVPLSNTQGEIAVLRMCNLQGGELDLSSVKWAKLSEEDQKDYFLNPGDILFNRTNSIDLVGKVGIVRGLSYPAAFASYLVRLTVKQDSADPYWLCMYLDWRPAQDRLRRMATKGASQANINPTSLRSFEIPLPPLSEQQQISELADAILNRHHAEVRVLATLQLTRSVVAEALFTGRSWPLTDLPTQGISAAAVGA